MINLPSRLAALVIATLALLSIDCVADDQDRHSQQHGARAQRPVKEAIGEVEQNYRGHVVDVKSQRKNETDENVYRMRVLQHDGRVKTVTVPANEPHRSQPD